MKISRGPIREALNALRHEGLIDIIHNRGGFVASLSIKEVLDCYDVRGGLAHTAGKLLPFTISLRQLDQLQQMQTKMQELLKVQDVRGYYRINKELHALLFEATDNATLITMNNVIERKLSLILHKEMSNPGVLKLSNCEHQEIINLIAEGKSAETAEAFGNHILKGKGLLQM